MATRVSVFSAPVTTEPTLGEEPTVLVSKVALTNDRADRRAEARWLDEARHSGVVVLRETSDDPFTIITEHAGGATLRMTDRSPDQIAAMMAAVARILADLHRAGMAHGKLTLDHIIIGSDGPVLCSPDGRIADAEVDLRALARCMRELRETWRRRDERVDFGPAWDLLADRLEAGDDATLSALRASHFLDRMLASTSETDNVDRSGRVRSALGPLPAVTGAALLSLALIGGLFAIDRSEPTTTEAISVEIDGSLYAVGSRGDQAVVLDHPCDPQSPVLVLDSASRIVWRYRTVADGARAEAVAIVPGATALDVETQLRPDRGSDAPCQVAVATGPAGRSVLDTLEE
jgi:hypothetical protein